MNVSECDVQLCSGNYKQCNYVPWEITLIFFNCVSAFVNCVHLIILSNIRSLRGKAYLVVLQHIAVADIVASIASCLRIACTIHNKATESRGFSAFISMIDFTLIVRYYILAAACTERAKALSNALRYDSSPLVSHMSMWLALIWVFCALVAVIRDVLFYDRLCVNRVTGPGNLNELEPSLMTAVEIIIPSVVTIVSLCKVAYEMTKMSGRSTNIQEQEIFAAAKYVKIITAVFFLCFIPTLMVFIGLYAGFFSAHFTSLAVFGHSIYGILNTAIYGWMTKPYRKQFRNLVSCCFIKKKDSAAQGALRS